MAASFWPTIEDLLDPAELTVRAQAVPPNDQDTLMWEDFMPRMDVDSVDLKDVTTIDYRPTADRREWNAQGRLIPIPTPARRDVSIVPIESRDRIDEKEMQRLNERTDGNSGRIREILGVDIPKRVERLALADYRRLEVDMFKAWTTGTIVQMNPETGQTYTASFGIDSDRITTEMTAWNDNSLNAYEQFLAWVIEAQDAIGDVEGVMMRLATLNAILADAPDLANSVNMTRSGLEQRLQDDLGTDFYIAINERSVDLFTDGGIAYTRTKIWPAEVIAAIPTGGVVGKSCFAPVVRAYELASQLGGNRIDVRGCSVYANVANAGKELEFQAQINAVPVPDEEKIFVVDVGV